VRETLELPRGTSPSYFMENIVTSAAVGLAGRSTQTASLLKVKGRAETDREYAFSKSGRRDDN